MKRPRSKKLFDEKQNHRSDKRKEAEKEEEEEEEEEDSGRESEYDLLLEEGAGERVFGRDRKYEGGKKDEEGEDQKGGKNKEEEKDKEEEEQEEKEAWENSDPVPDLDIGDHSSFEEKESPLVESGQSNSLPKHGWTTNVETSTELSAAKESQQSYSVIHVSYWTHGL